MDDKLNEYCNNLALESLKEIENYLNLEENKWKKYKTVDNIVIKTSAYKNSSIPIFKGEKMLKNNTTTENNLYNTFSNLTIKEYKLFDKKIKTYQTIKKLKTLVIETDNNKQQEIRLQIDYIASSVGPLISDRELMFLACSSVFNDKLISWFVSLDDVFSSKLLPLSKNRVRGRLSIAGYAVVRINNNKSKFVRIIHLDPKLKNIPNFLIKSQATSQVLNALNTIESISKKQKKIRSRL
eukprot:TRINITY_DN2537_c0_g1_i1.p1 TRINITY_DN2537_c0_g1~~TRINITY_DN2537_c0_g1_i1.p1  ORF type:complete len:239 (+),score=28.64 TRINITY_DN2537_c0_g1_i1:55-771(+)